jgi:hypothetical protein
MQILNNNGNQTCNFLLRIFFFVLFLFFLRSANFLNKHDIMLPSIKLIADSGSTKTEWCLLKNNKPTLFTTQGMSPYFVNAAQAEQIIRT